MPDSIAFQPAASTSGRPPPRGPAFWILAFILVLSPVPFASVAPVWSWLYGLLIALALILGTLGRWRANRGLPGLPRSLWAAGGLVLAVALWGYVQSLPGLAPDAQPAAWPRAAALLESPELAGHLSLVPERSRLVATQFLIYLGFGLLVLWQARHQRNRALLLRIFLATQGAGALYGIGVYFAGLETILWFDKTAYLGVLTGTFVNRNTYATHAGLGALAALALSLRFLRHTLGAETSGRVRAREFVERLLHWRWIVPMVLLLCFVAVLLTGSRMGFMAMLIGACVLLAGWIVRLPAGQARALGGVLLTVLLALLIANVALSGGLTAERLARLFTDGDGRFDVYPLVLGAIAERPWTGYGLGAFESAFRPFRDESIPLLFDRAHSDYLELIMDVGWPAALAMFLAGLLLLGAALRRAGAGHPEPELALLAAAATVQVGVHATVDFSLQAPAVVFAWLLLALLAFAGSPAGRPAPA